MLHWLIERRLTKLEKQLGVPLDYLRHILKTSTRAFFKFLKITPLASYRRACPADAIHVARLVAVLHEDCGPCVQIGVNAARQDGVKAEVLKAVLARQPESLPAPLPDVYHFAAAVVTNSADLDDRREAVRDQLGEEALVELAMGIASCRFFPVTKRALGFARSCARVQIDV
ncbi:MAG TPA: hypothetical protein PKD86_12410 [Gemmatales bacterium]|nr:hypothetical protein [Gemmatales bacterium]HMP60145.1 hypothetical protein [Gemmatales bacterium]